MMATLLAPKRVRFGASYSVVCDGNSLTYGLLASNRNTASYPAVLATFPLLAGSAVINIGISGQNAADMLSNRSDLNAAWSIGKKNVLLACEGTNSIYGGRTPAQAASDLLAYAATAKSEKDWLVVLVGTIPIHGPRFEQSYTQANVNSYNEKISEFNGLLNAGWRGVADHYIDIQSPGSGFLLQAYDVATFDATGLYVAEGQSRVHCSDAGYAEMARVIGLGLARLPGRAP